jgi:uncharacterized protein (TIGR02246 family)
MRRYINPLLLMLLIGLPTALAAQAGGNQRQDVLAFVRAYVDASNRGDMTAYVNMYAQRPDLVVVSDGQISRGWESVREEANQMMGTEGAYRISAGVVDVLNLSPDIAIAVFPFVVTLTTPQGQQQLRGAMSLVLQKTADGLRIIHDHTSIAAPSQ